MKISLNWLKEYIDLSDISVDEISHKLTMCGLEVEDVHDENEKFKGFIVGYVKEKSKHPNADKLSVCTVSTGTEDLQVICGAPNVAQGQKVIFAPVGTFIPGGNFEIKKAKIRGLESSGMICAEDELGLGTDHSGIMILDENLKEGTPITEALNLNDVVMEIGITPNRPDALSHFGVARDLAAIFEREFKTPEININESNESIDKAASIEIIDEVNCPRYSSRVIKGIEVKESPQWLKDRLSKVGLRPINNIVDVTNYVMYETGQPLHAFDLDTLAKNKIVVQSTSDKTKFITLDSKERELQANTLLICDGEKPVAIAGVMGGENSEITITTKNILIESAYFRPGSIRKTARLTGLSTDASYRFERGINPDGTMYSANRAAELIQQVAGGEILKGSVDVYPNKISELQIELRFARIKKILGYEIPSEQVATILKNLGFKILSQEENKLLLSSPLFRPDIEREIDIIEELARIYGYDNIPTISKISITLGEKTDESALTDKFRNTATALGFYEVVNNPLTSEKGADITGKKIPLLNPQSAEMSILRTSLIPGMLETISRNINAGEKNLMLFEVGNIFNRTTEGEIKSFEDFEETTEVTLAITGKIKTKDWENQEKSFSYYDIKRFADSFLCHISLDFEVNDFYNLLENNLFDYYFTKVFNNKEIAIGGKVKKDLLAKFDIDQDVYLFTLNAETLKTLKNKDKKFKELLKYPKVYRDFAFIFDKEIEYKEVEKFILTKSSGLLKSLKLFDIFESDTLGNNKKSLAFNLEFFAEDRTLKEEEVEKEFNHLIKEVSKKFNATLRGL